MDNLCLNADLQRRAAKPYNNPCNQQGKSNDNRPNKIFSGQANGNLLSISIRILLLYTDILPLKSFIFGFRSHSSKCTKALLALIINM